VDQRSPSLNGHNGGLWTSNVVEIVRGPTVFGPSTKIVRATAIPLRLTSRGVLGIDHIKIDLQGRRY
jgi:hypothetical protein